MEVMLAAGLQTASAGALLGYFGCPQVPNLGHASLLDSEPSGTICDTWELHQELSSGEFLLCGNHSRTALTEHAATLEAPKLTVFASENTS